MTALLRRRRLAPIYVLAYAGSTTSNIRLFFFLFSKNSFPLYLPALVYTFLRMQKVPLPLTSRSPVTGILFFPRKLLRRHVCLKERVQTGLVARRLKVQLMRRKI